MKMLTFGEWLQGKRGRKGDPGFVSQNELAKRMGVTRSYIGQLEDPTKPTPTFPTRQKVHAALGSSEQELVDLGIVRTHSPLSGSSAVILYRAT
jgi:transcriptional regulator with XRE-family HTH domain